ncbi:Helicase SRCAP [Aphelenchoides bicaudatus]|nr:Helicase SRCAP [Aphelenchoides bicaudatus]
MDKPTSQNSPARARIRNDLLRVYFCRKLLNEGLLTAEQLYPAENNVEHERRVETPSSEFASSPLAVNGTVTPNLEPSNVNRLFNRQPDQLTLQLEHTVIAPRSWNCGVYSPIEVLIDSPSAIDNSGQTSTMLSSIAPSEDMSTESDLFEMDVLERINRLRRQGKWSLTRLPLCLDAPRPKTHHDYFLEECMMMQIDFVHERVTKKMAAKMLAYEAKHYVQQKNSGVINLCTTLNQTSKRTRKRAGDSINDLISNLPADYVGDLKSRVVSSNLFNDLQTTDFDRWKLVEDVIPIFVTFAAHYVPYQLVALKWLLNSFDNSFGCILTDEKGLGKKVQILAFLAFLEDFRRVTGPHLIVTDEKANWSIALERFLPHANVLEFTDQKEDMLHSFNICLVDHETFRSETFTNSFGNCAFQVQVVDKVDQMEFLEENDSKESFLHGDYRFRVFIGNSKFLEQTFEKKRLPTILLQFLLPKQFQNAFESGLNDEELAKVDEKQLVSFLQAFHLSRTKEQIADQIPSENLEVCKCRMTSKQQKFYNKLIELPEVKQGLNSDKALQVMDLLRKCCSHPFLVQEEQMQEKTPFNFSLFYPILRQCFLDNDQSEFCEQLKFEESFRTRLQRLQTSSLDIAEKPTQSLVCCSPPATDKLNLNLQSAISTYPFQFVGPNTSSLSTVWQRNQSNQLANEMFKKRSPQDDTELTNSCVHLPDKSLILPHSGKLQEVFKKLAEVRKQKKRCIIFTSYQSTQQLLCEALAHHSFAYMLLSENANRKEFLDAFNKNQRIACVVASTRDSLYRLNLNNIGAVFVLETDWKFEHNDNIKRFFVKSYQTAGAKFYNFITEDSIEVRTNLLDTDVKPLLSEISRSIVNSTTTEQNGTIETNDQDADKDVVPEITTIFAPICHDADGVESISDTLSSSGYEGSLDENASLHAEPLVYDKNFLESDSYLASVFGLQWRHHANNDKFGFVEEAQVFDSFSNSWYTGDVIEPDEIEYIALLESPDHSRLLCASKLS